MVGKLSVDELSCLQDKVFVRLLLELGAQELGFYVHCLVDAVNDYMQDDFSLTYGLIGKILKVLQVELEDVPLYLGDTDTKYIAEYRLELGK